MTNDTCNFSHCFCMFELHLRFVGMNMISQIAAIKRYSVTGGVKGRKDACENLQLACTHAYGGGEGECERK